MTSPTIGITILIILACAILGQLLIQGSEHKKRYRELHDQLKRLEDRLPK